MNHSILLDMDSLWQRFDCEEKAIAEGFDVVHFDDDMKLRRYYEFECQDQPDAPRILVIDRGALYVPIDIARQYPVVRLSLQGLFPTMDCDVLSELPGLDFDHLAFIADQLPLQKMDKQQTWKYLTDDYATQERFFRQYYNAFKGRLNEPFRQSSERKDPLGNMATRSNLLEIYESLINYNLPAFLEDVLACGEIYAKLIFSMEPNGKYARPLKDLAHIQGVPSYVLLLFLFRFQAELEINESLMVGIIKLLISFFVRRNIMDVPPTRDLTRIFMGIIQTIEENGLKADAIKQLVQKTLADCSASDALFEEKLKGDIYEDNSMVARFVLCSLTERSMTTETWTDLWEQNATQNGQKVYAWTIEHIFPEGDNIPQDWVNMIAGGDAELAKKYRMEYVHKLGNLTVTRYNSALSNFSFEKKRDRQKDGLYVGYKNGLEINREIAQKDRWTVQDIMARTEELAAELLKIYSLS